MIFYTYLIGWKQLNKWYYGVRYSKQSNPNELFVTYFTSSKKVKEFIKCNGYPDVIQVRKTFSCATKARVWEGKVLKKLNVINDNRWLNLTDNYSIPLEKSIHGWSDESRKKLSSYRTGKMHSQETKNKIGRAHKGRDTPWLTGKKRPDHSQKMKGSNNPNARKVFFNNKYYGTLKEFCMEFSLTEYHARKLISGNSY